MKNQSMQPVSDKLDLVAFMSALCLFLSTLEYIIPKPLPFMRIGLANLPILVALYILPASSIFLLILLKVLGQGLIQGSLFSYVFLFSFVSSISSGLVMLLVSRIFKKHISLIGISITGALASNISQILLAVYLIFGRSGWIIAPPLLIVGIISSVMLGAFAQKFFHKSLWVKNLLKSHNTALNNVKNL